MKLRPTFADLEPRLRVALAEYLAESRRKDRDLHSEKGWVSQSRGVAEYLFCLGIMPTYLFGRLSRQAKQVRLNYFEAGIGKFAFGRTLLERYLGRILAEGLRLTYSAELKDLEGLKQRVGLLESRALECPFDLAISARGAFVYSLQSFAAIEELVNSLKVGAIAYVDDAKLLLPKPWFRSYLASYGVGIEVSRYERGAPYAYKLSRRNGDRLDLSAFSSRYVQLLNSSAATILEWGFDRTRRSSPLTALLSSLYEKERYADLLVEMGNETPPSLGEGVAFRNREAEVLEIAGVTYVNDGYSKDLEDLEESFERWRDRRIFWIAGGEGAANLKRSPKFSAWGALFFGAERQALGEAWKSSPLRFLGQEIKDCAEAAYQAARPGDVVLFSPGLLPAALGHGTLENRAADFRRCLGEIWEMADWKRG